LKEGDKKVQKFSSILFIFIFIQFKNIFQNLENCIISFSFFSNSQISDLINSFASEIQISIKKSFSSHFIFK
jgi:hypothetical protein